MNAANLAKWERRVRSLILKLPPKMAVSFYSRKRLEFLRELGKDFPRPDYNPPKYLSRTLWGINFKSPLMNAAGMFKNGECYVLAARQGAGAYLGGTGTWDARTGNIKSGIHLPFIPYPNSRAASNCLGLPNDGDYINSRRFPAFSRSELKCPIGWSVAESPSLPSQVSLPCLLDSLWHYYEAGVDFLEVNESCPNSEDFNSRSVGWRSMLAERLAFIKENFLGRRKRNCPVIVKFSNDTRIEHLPALLDLLFELGFSGVNFGNTSTDYAGLRDSIHPNERKLYDFFTSTFGGGVSGAPLKEKSLELCSRAVEYLRAGPPLQEFHVVRTGGIETWQDVDESERAGISLNQWFAGYFDAFAKSGHSVYRELFRNARKNGSRQT